MNRSTSARTRRRLGLVGMTAAVALGPALAAQAEPSSAPPNIGLNVSRELQRQGSIGGTIGAGAFMDRSTVTGCMSVNPEPLTYSTREIILREDLTPQAAKGLVNQVIGAGGPGKAVSAK